MFKALHKLTGDEIIILEPRWRRQLGILRQLDTQDVLVCQGCSQPVRVRAGHLKRWHFAHKHLQNCPYAFESPILLQTRAVLYEWLIRQLGEETVTLEKNVSLTRPVDCWVSSASGDLGYWIIDNRLPPAERKSLAEGLARVCPHPVWVFTSSMLREDEASLERLYLTTTEREFMRHTVFDQAVQSTYPVPGASLHYLESEREVLITFRGLQVYHGPQLYSGSRHENPLNQVRVVPETGEFTHPGEDQRLARYRMAVFSRARQQQETERRINQKMADLFGGMQSQPDLHTSTSVDAFPQPERLDEADLPACVFCGKRTDDYWYLNRADNTCKCRDCYRQEKY